MIEVRLKFGAPTIKNLNIYIFIVISKIFLVKWMALGSMNKLIKKE